MSRCINEPTQLLPSDPCILQWKQRPDEAELKLLIGDAAPQTSAGTFSESNHEYRCWLHTYILL